MMILSLVRNYLPSREWVRRGGWNIADSVARSYDLEGMDVGTVAAGRIGLAVLRRLAPFDVRLHYTDRHRLPAAVEEELGLTFHASTQDMVPHCDVVTINAPLHPETQGLFGDELLGTAPARSSSPTSPTPPSATSTSSSTPGSSPAPERTPTAPAADRVDRTSEP
jgi:formate dehydrogenase